MRHRPWLHATLAWLLLLILLAPLVWLPFWIEQRRADNAERLDIARERLVRYEQQIALREVWQQRLQAMREQYLDALFYPADMAPLLVGSELQRRLRELFAEQDVVLDGLSLSRPEVGEQITRHPLNLSFRADLATLQTLIRRLESLRPALSMTGLQLQAQTQDHNVPVLQVNLSLEANQITSGVSL